MCPFWGVAPCPEAPAYDLNAAAHALLPIALSRSSSEPSNVSSVRRLFRSARIRAGGLMAWCEVLSSGWTDGGVFDLFILRR